MRHIILVVMIIILNTNAKILRTFSDVLYDNPKQKAIEYSIKLNQRGYKRVRVKSNGDGSWYVTGRKPRK